MNISYIVLEQQNNQVMKSIKNFHYEGSNKRNDSIRKLSENLFSKFQGLGKDVEIGDDTLSKFACQYTPTLNSVENLISKANIARKNNEHKISLARKSKIQKDGCTFLTGTGLYQNQHSCTKQQQVEVPEAPTHMQILKNLIQNEDADDLAELRKMLKETGQNIQNCRRKVYKTQKTIVNYASGLNLDANNSRNINSMNKIISKCR